MRRVVYFGGQVCISLNLLVEIRTKSKQMLEEIFFVSLNAFDERLALLP